jgi:deoxyribodipyrimidine photo-lyase
VTALPTPTSDRATDWVGDHLGHLVRGSDVRASPRFRGTQAAADAALAALDIAGYAARRNEVLPVSRRGATALSPYIRHGLLTLPRVWDAVDGAPAGDRRKFRDELLWQEYARHVYARLGSRHADGLRRRLPARPDAPEDPWDRSMACVDLAIGELERDGWMVNQTRMWMASQWSVRHGADWRAGEDRFFTHLLDGSRAANRLGWQWTIGTGTGKPYGFSRWQVTKRAPGLCDGCVHRRACPIEHWPDDPVLADAPDEPLLRRDPDPAATAGPIDVERTGEPDTVWITAESLGDDDPALAANPDLPIVFAFDEALLGRLRLASTRLVFLTERLAELAATRDLEVHLGDPAAALAGRRLATTFTPVPKGRRLRAVLDVVELRPWSWLRRPGSGSIRSFSAWRGR